MSDSLPFRFFETPLIVELRKLEFPLSYFHLLIINPALELLELLLKYDPNSRISAADALKHPYFTPSVLTPAPNDAYHRRNSESSEASSANSNDDSMDHDGTVAYFGLTPTGLAP